MAESKTQNQQNQGRQDAQNDAPDPSAALLAELEALRTQNAQLAGRLTEAETARTRAELATMSEAERRVVAQQEACDGQIASLNSEADALQAQIASLQAEGNFAEASAVYRRLAKSEAALYNEQQRKNWLANQREQIKTQNEAARTAQPRAGERYLANNEKTPLSTFDNQPEMKAWIDRHPQMFTDPRYVAQAFQAHYAAVRDGVQPNSREYFRYLDSGVGETDGSDGGQRDGGGGLRGRSEAGGSADGSPYSGSENRSAGADVDYSVSDPQRGAAGPGSLGGIPPSRTPPKSGNGSGGARGFAPLNEEEREVADALYPHIANLSDRYQKYREDQGYMNERQFGRNR